MHQAGEWKEERNAESSCATEAGAYPRVQRFRRDRHMTARPVEVSRQAINASTVGVDTRPEVRGKFIYAGDEKLYVRGVTYGTFRPHADGSEYGNPHTVEQDFIQMA